MAHNRSQIRDALAALVGPAIAPIEFYVERRYRIDTTLRPLVVMSLGENAIADSEMSMGSPAYNVEHVQAATFELHAQGDSGEVCSDQIDQLELEVEQAIAADLTLSGLCEMIYPVGSELEMETTQDRVIAVRSVVYSVVWRCEFGQPDTPEG